MAKIVISENITLDGVVQDPSGAEGFRLGGWVGRVGDRGREEAARVLLDESLGAEALLQGRRTYEFLAARWPSRTGELADRMNSIPKYVVSSTLEDPGWNNSTVLKGDVVSEVAKLRQELNGEIVVAGSIQLVHTLMEHDLVDELRMMVYPVVLGAGNRLFVETSDKKSVRLLGTRIVDDLAYLTYQVIQATSRCLENVSRMPSFGCPHHRVGGMLSAGPRADRLSSPEHAPISHLRRRICSTRQAQAAHKRALLALPSAEWPIRNRHPNYGGFTRITCVPPRRKWATSTTFPGDGRLGAACAEVGVTRCAALLRYRLAYSRPLPDLVPYITCKEASPVGSPTRGDGNATGCAADGCDPGRVRSWRGGTKGMGNRPRRMRSLRGRSTRRARPAPTSWADDTYEAMAAVWPTANGVYADVMNEIPKVVFSATLTHADWGRDPDGQLVTW